MRDLRERALWDDQLRQILEKGWPLTKASYLALSTMGEAPDFPLHPEFKSTIPRELAGKVPRTPAEYWAAWALAPLPSAPPAPVKT